MKNITNLDITKIRKVAKTSANLVMLNEKLNTCELNMMQRKYDSTKRSGRQNEIARKEFVFLNNMNIKKKLFEKPMFHSIGILPSPRGSNLINELVFVYS